MPDGFWESEEVMSEKDIEKAISNIENQNSKQPVEEELEESDDTEVLDNESYESELENDENDEDDDVEVLRDASLRLEQGSLYKMLLNHNLFENIDADPKAIQNVQREIRGFIKERLEILVGLKEDPKLKKKEAKEQFPAGIFDKEEIMVLKEFLSKALKKNTLNTINKNSIAPVKQEKQFKINPIKNVSGKSNSSVKVITQKVKQNNDLKTKPQQKNKVENSSRKPLTKPPSKMTIEELIEYNKQISYKKAESTKKLPMPDDRQVYMNYASKQSDPSGTRMLGLIMNAMGKKLQTSEIVESPNMGENNERI